MTRFIRQCVLSALIANCVVLAFGASMMAQPSNQTPDHQAQIIERMAATSAAAQPGS